MTISTKIAREIAFLRESNIYTVIELKFLLLFFLFFSKKNEV